jgi:HAD superfamily hydrolase (TIGR01484 family)
MKTIVFNLDGTLTESKETLDEEMAALLVKLLQNHNVAIVAGASWKQFQKQVVNQLRVDSSKLNNLYLLPTSGGSMYQTWSKYGWVATYQHKLHRRDIARITKTIEESLEEIGFEKPKKLWGRQIETRESQVTFSALGQNAPSEVKDKYDPDYSRRRLLLNSLQKKLPAYDICIGGRTSIDISLRGINKKYGIDELMKRLHISKDDVIFVGNSIFKGGSNYVAVEMGLEYFEVRDVEDTRNWIREILDAEVLEKSA